MCLQFRAVILLDQDVVMPQMSLYIYRVGPPFLDNHYLGYQYVQVQSIIKNYYTACKLVCYMKLLLLPVALFTVFQGGNSTCTIYKHGIR